MNAHHCNIICALPVLLSSCIGPPTSYLPWIHFLAFPPAKLHFFPVCFVCIIFYQRLYSASVSISGNSFKVHCLTDCTYITRNSSLNCKRGWKGELEFLKRWLQKLWKFRMSRKCYKFNSVHMARQTPKMRGRHGWFMCHLAHYSWLFYVLESLSQTVLKLLSKVSED